MTVKMREFSLRVSALVACAVAALASTAAAEELWTTNPDIPTFYNQFLIGPSAITPVLNSEVADDFNVIGTIERVDADGEDCRNGCFDGQPVTGVYVRFYEWTPDGPGTLQDEQYLANGDPNFNWSPNGGPQYFEITLPQPFQATGQHFVSVQLAIDGSAYQDRWHFYAVNAGATMGAPAYYRDLNQGGDWAPFHTTVGWSPVDASFRLMGVYGGEPDPVIIDVAAAPATPSGRMRVNGDGFGDEQVDSRILVNGVEAVVTRWDDLTIIAYVPEETQPGTALVELKVGGEIVDSFDLSIEARQPDGHVKWRFAVDDDYISHRPGIGPDGKVYTHDVHGRLYAISEDGALLWTVDALRGQIGLGAEGPTVVGNEGLIYLVVNPLGPTTDLVAYNPDGTLKWVYVEQDSWGAAVGPAIGPDGNVYVAFYDVVGNTSGLMSFTPDGTVRWNNPGSPHIYEHGAFGAELVFGASEIGGVVDQVVLTVDRDDDRHLYAFDMETGAQNWTSPRGVLDAIFFQNQLQPGAGPDGTIYMTEFTGFGGLGWGLKAIDPSNGQDIWRFDPDILSTISGPDIGSDGTIYVSWDISRVGALHPDGTSKWTHVDFDGINTMPRVSPNNDVVVVAGGPFGEPGRIKGLNAATGEELWRVQLPVENGNVWPNASAMFTPDGSTAYFVTDIAADPEPYRYCYLYALQVTDEPAGPDGDLDGDGDIDQADLGILLSCYGVSDCGDIDGDGDTDQADLGALLGNYGV